MSKASGWSRALWGTSLSAWMWVCVCYNVGCASESALDELLKKTNSTSNKNNKNSEAPLKTPLEPNPEPPKSGPDPKTRYPGMVHVPEGKFWRGADDGDPDEKPVREIFLSEFWIDTYEVTVDQYRACVKAGICSAPASSGCGDEYNNWTQNRGDHPVNCVSWTQSDQYCRWAGKRLPTEAQWEKAARGTEGWTYPWGEAKPTCDYAVMDDGGLGCGLGTTWPVGSKAKGKSPYGAYDMSGNVWEWVADWYSSDGYQSALERDPEGPKSGSRRVFRGGSFNYYVVSGLRAALRGRGVPAYVYYFLGFRCARFD